MNTLIHSMIEDTKSPSIMHALWVHFPIAASFIGLVLLIALLITGVRSNGMRWACVLVYGLAAFTAFMAFQTGSTVASNVSTTIDSDTQLVLQSHQEMGDKAWIFLLVTTVFVAGTAFRMVAVRATMITLALIAALSSAAWISVTAHYGGALVYRHGVGMASVTSTPASSGKAHHAGTTTTATTHSASAFSHVTTAPATEPAVEATTKP